MNPNHLWLLPKQFTTQFNACLEGVDFACKYQTMKEVWDNCPRVSWMLWIANKLQLKLDQKAIRLFACWCVRNTPISNSQTVWDLLTDERSRNAVIVAERFANGEATIDELRQAHSAADAAYAYAAAADATAAYAAYATTADAAYAYAYAAAAADAAADAAAADAKRKAQLFQADAFRKIIPNPWS